MQMRAFTEPQLGTDYDTILAHALAAEQHGFDAWFTSDHLLTMGGADMGAGPTDAWTTLAGLARDTSTIRLGTLVTPVTFRFPGHFAVQVAQVDAMSGGRVEVGLGSGWYEAEHRAMGIPFPDTATRVAMRDEWAEALTGLWATPDGATFTYRGEHVVLEDNPARPRPVQQPGPPIVMGGTGRVRTPRATARWAAEYNGIFTEPDDYADLTALVRAACEAEGRDPDDLVWSVAQRTCVGATEAEFRARAEATGQDPDRLRGAGVCGTPDEARARVEQFRALGCERIYLQTLDIGDTEHLALLAETLG